jgi:hypothetical protein
MVKTAFKNEPPEALKKMLTDSAGAVLAGGTWVSNMEEAVADLEWATKADWSEFVRPTYNVPVSRPAALVAEVLTAPRKTRRPPTPLPTHTLSPKEAAALSDLPADKGGVPHPEQLYPSVTEYVVVIGNKTDGRYIVWATDSPSLADTAARRAAKRWKKSAQARPANPGEVAKFKAENPDLSTVPTPVAL